MTLDSLKTHVGFDPIVNNKTKILILGSLPGPESLASGEYYKKSSNSLWRIMFALFDETPSDDYGKKCAFLLKNKIGLWDVFYSATREGAADTAIKNGITNDFGSFLAAYPGIKVIIFNGLKARNAFKRAHPDLFKKITNRTAWSTSGACAKTFADKYENWRATISSFLT